MKEPPGPLRPGGSEPKSSRLGKQYASDGVMASDNFHAYRQSSTHALSLFCVLMLGFLCRNTRRRAHVSLRHISPIVARQQVEIVQQCPDRLARVAVELGEDRFNVLVGWIGRWRLVCGHANIIGTRGTLSSPYLIAAVPRPDAGLWSAPPRSSPAPDARSPWRRSRPSPHADWQCCRLHPAR